MQDLIVLKDLSKYYHSGEVITLGLRKINLSFKTGEFVAVVGESGSGKSTMMNVISGMDTYEEGELFIRGEETSCFTQDEWVRYRKDNIAFIFQDYNLIDSYTVLQNVELALYDTYPDRKQRRARALDLIDKVELTSHKNHRCTKLSGGQKQRVAIARALAKDAPILIADEPTGNLDEGTGKAIIKLLSDLSKDKLVLMVTHEFNDVSEYATRKIRLFDGSVVEDRTIREREDGVEIKVKTVQEEESKFKSFMLNLRNLISISFHNIIATPKKSIFIFTTAMLSSFVFILYFFMSFNGLLDRSEFNSYGYRKDTVLIYTAERDLFNEETRKDIESITGVETAMLQYVCVNKSLITMQPVILNTYSTWLSIKNLSSYDKKYVPYGNFPANDNEILIGFSGFDEPDLELLGKTLDFSVSDHYYGMGEKYYQFKIAGFVSGEGCYLTTKAIETLSYEFMINSYKNDNFEINIFKDSTNGYDDRASSMLDKELVITDKDVPEGNMYIVYDTKFSYKRSFSHYDIYDFVERNNIEDIKGNINSNLLYHARLNIKKSTSSENTEFYEKYYDENIVILLNPADFPFDEEIFTSSNSALVIMDVNYNFSLTIDRLKKAGYKVVYKYSFDDNYYNKFEKMTEIIGVVLLGLFFMSIGIVLLSEIINKTMRSRNKDFNILRTLGYSDNQVKSINYLELLIVNIVGYLTVFFAFLITYFCIKHFGSIKQLNVISLLIPNNFFSYLNVINFSISFIMVVAQTMLIIRRNNRKKLKLSIKKALLEE